MDTEKTLISEEELETVAGGRTVPSNIIRMISRMGTDCLKCSPGDARVFVFRRTEKTAFSAALSFTVFFFVSRPFFSLLGAPLK